MSWEIDRQKILTADEVEQVLDDLRRRAKRSANSRLLLTIFRLATFTGLRASEIVQLQLRDLRLDNGRPHVHVRAEATKRTRKRAQRKSRGAKGRSVPIWDVETLADLQAWKKSRVEDGAKPADPVVVSLRRGTVPANPQSGTKRVTSFGKPLTRQSLTMKFRTACRALGAERASDLHAHVGRHTFASLALRAGKSLVQVRDALGHASVAVTDIYLSIVGEDDTPGDLLGRKSK